MKALWLGKSDDSGTSNRIARAVNKQNGALTMRCVALKSSVCGYEEDICLDRDPAGQVFKLVEEADWIIQMGDDDYSNFWQMLAKFSQQTGTNPYKLVAWMKGKGKRLATRHAGTLYRNNSEMYRKWDRKFEFKRCFYPCDLYRFGIDDETVRPFIPPQDSFANEPWNGKKVSFCHTPSNMDKKGTVSIIEAMTEAHKTGRVKFAVYTGHSYDEIVKLRAPHVVFIDQQWPIVGGFGGAAMEALSQAKVLVTNDTYVCEEVERWFPRPPTITVESTSELVAVINNLRDNHGRVREFSEQSLTWAKKYLGSEFTYQYWVEALR